MLAVIECPTKDKCNNGSSSSPNTDTAQTAEHETTGLTLALSQPTTGATGSSI